MGSILVTGAAGFIGTNFVRYWAETHPGDRVVALDVLTYAGVRENVDGIDGVTFVHADIGDTAGVEQVLEEHAVDRVVNFAAESHNSLAILDPARFFRTNVLGTQGLCEAARRVGVARFHHVSTCEVYGDLVTRHRREVRRGIRRTGRARRTTPPRRAATTSCARTTRPGTCRSRSRTAPTTTAPFQFPEKVIPYFTTLALQDLPLPMYASTQNRREWIHALDHCRAIDMILSNGRIGETYHVGTGVEKSVEQIADTVLSHLGKPESLKTIVPDRPGHDRRYVLDWSKIERELGWAPTVAWEAGIAETIDWYAANREWWEPLRDRAPVAEGSAWKS